MTDHTTDRGTEASGGKDLWSPEYPSPYEIDPVVAAYLPGVDRSLLRENLKLTHEQRLLKAQAAGEMFDELRCAGRSARQRSSTGE